MGQAPPPWSWTKTTPAADWTGRGARSTSSVSGPSKGRERQRLGSGSPHSRPHRHHPHARPSSQAHRTAGEQAALDHGVTVRRGQGYTLCVSTTEANHRQIRAGCQARREYENRVSALISTRPLPIGHQPVQARDDIVHIATGLYRKGLLRPAADRQETNVFWRSPCETARIPQSLSKS